LRPAHYKGRFQPWHLSNEDLATAGATVSVAAPEAFSIIWKNSLRDSKHFHCDSGSAFPDAQ